jgi:hypothetical protein
LLDVDFGDPDRTAMLSDMACLPALSQDLSPPRGLGFTARADISRYAAGSDQSQDDRAHQREGRAGHNPLELVNEVHGTSPGFDVT